MYTQPGSPYQGLVWVSQLVGIWATLGSFWLRRLGCCSRHCSCNNRSGLASVFSAKANASSLICCSQACCQRLAVCNWYWLARRFCWYKLSRLWLTRLILSVKRAWFLGWVKSHVLAGVALTELDRLAFALWVLVFWLLAWLTTSAIPRLSTTSDTAFSFASALYVVFEAVKGERYHASQPIRPTTNTTKITCKLVKMVL